MLINPCSINTAFTVCRPEGLRNAHNAESITIAQAVCPIIDALTSKFVINELSDELPDQWLGESGELPRRERH